MKLKDKISGYIIRSAAIAILLSCAIVGFSSAFVSPGSDSKLRRLSQSALPSSGQTKTLTFADRVAYQRAIEEVYWRHRIWPKERPDPKPSLDAVMSQAQLERKVEDYIRNSQALEAYWQRPITPEELQAEMERMAHYTRQPGVLRELFQALGDDPFVIAECLARPVLTQRTLMHLNDEDRVKLTKVAWPKASLTSFVSIVRTQAPMEVAAIDSTSNAFGVQMNRPYELPTISGPSGVCIDDTWTATSLTNAPSARSNHTAVWTGTEMIVWGGYNGTSSVNTGGRYDAGTDSWTATSTINAPVARSIHTAVWTGSEMIVWGGDNGSPLNTGGRYNPSTDSWTATSTNNAPEGRRYHTAVWVGSEMIVWGGYNGTSSVNTGGRYSPGTDSWTATTTINAPDARSSHTAVSTGSEMIVWGGESCSPCMDFNTGGRYHPGTDSWVATSTSNAPAARFDQTAVWTGSQMIVWGGVAFPDTLFNTGGRYTPDTDSWTPTSTTNAPSAREEHRAVWTSTEMIVWGGPVSGGETNTGGRYDAAMDSWTATSITNAPTARSGHTAVWTGSQMIIWGGAASGPIYFNTGGRYCTQSGATPTPTPTPTATATATATPSPTLTPRPTPTPRSRPTPAPRPSP